MFHKKIEEFIKNTGEGVVLDYVDGQFILANKSFIEGKPSTIERMQAFGRTLDDCVDNFVYLLEKKEFKNNIQNDDDIESYRWYCSY
jgi:hypothetical protein